MKNKIIRRKSRKRKGFKFKKKQYNKKNNNKNKVFIIILLTIIYNFLIYLEKNNYTKKESSIFNLKLKKNNYNKLKNITKNDQKYKGLENCFLYNKEEDYCIYQLLIPKKVINKSLILLGGKQDGGYVLLDDFDNIKIVYSFGIGEIIRFDYYFAKRNIDVYMYDHTINSLPYENPKFHWKKIGLTGNKLNNNTSLKTLDELLRENGHLNEKNMILKMDVEYPEWEVLSNISQNILKQFKYLLIEFHLNFGKISYYYKVFKKLLNTHEIFYIHCNGCGVTKFYGKNIICNALEVSYIIKDNYQFTKDDSIYPIPELETRNCGKLSNIDLNLFKLFDYK